MPRGLRNKHRKLLEDMGFNAHKIDRREKMSRQIATKNQKRKKRYYNA